MMNGIFSSTEIISESVRVLSRCFGAGVRGVVICLVLFIGLIFGAPGYADDCRGKAMTQTAMNLCALDKAKKADAALNDIYEKLMKKAGAAGQAKLRAAQKAWLSYRDLQCAFDTLGTAGGSVHPMIVSECHAYYARLHRKDLEAQLDCAEGNLSCGGQ